MGLLSGYTLAGFLKDLIEVTGASDYSVEELSQLRDLVLSQVVL